MKPKNNGKMQIKIESVSAKANSALRDLAESLAEDVVAMSSFNDFVKAYSKYMFKLSVKELEVIAKTSVVDKAVIFSILTEISESVEMASDDGEYESEDDAIVKVLADEYDIKASPDTYRIMMKMFKV